MILSCKKTKVNDLQSGALLDVVDLGSSLVASAQPIMSDDPLNALTISLLQAILDTSDNYSSAIVPGQKAVDLVSSNIRLNLSVALIQAPNENISFSGSSQNKSRRALAFKPVPLSTCVVRLTPPAPPSLMAGQKVSVAGYFAAELVGVRMNSPGNFQQESSFKKSWSCSNSGAGCVQFTVSVSQPNLGKMNRWTGDVWSESFCKVGGIERLTTLSSVQVNCTCDQDGIFKVTVDSFPESMVWPAPVQSLAFVGHLHSMRMTILMGLLALALVVLASFTVIQTYFRLSDITKLYYGDTEHWSVTFRKNFCPCGDLGHKSPLQESMFSFRAQNIFKHKESNDPFQSSYMLYFPNCCATQPILKYKDAVVYESLNTPFSRFTEQDLNSGVVREKVPLDSALEGKGYNTTGTYSNYALYHYEDFSFRAELCYLTDK
eukprot:CAMPEP_0172212454 /NCGR_PEP_ID=MMETSP1050-20130122/37020_1 /TAXON_ID=233186 /ORGANISM="Cryptomonas curvata, Strain CCAP979/52" /LENGTH=432 /DNA_ID=CAMNT_0012893125 /DNA_START=148 /DNA_END=1447 /DNA_ORIENTATION=+